MDDINNYRIVGNEFIGFSVQKLSDPYGKEKTWVGFCELGMPEDANGWLGVFKVKQDAINYIKGKIKPIQYFYGPDFKEGKDD